MEETNRPDERVQPPSHGGGNEDEDLLDLRLMDLIPVDGLMDQLRSIIQSCCLCFLLAEVSGRLSVSVCV